MSRGNIKITVNTSYLHQESDPDNNKFYFLYTVSISNQGSEGAKLLSRHWVIEDANGKIQNVKGEGVVGDQPYINPGDEYQYTSGTLLETSFGTMKGSYQMVSDSDSFFDAEIPEFVLSIPRVIH